MPNPASDVFKLGVIGIDSSHLPAFAGRMNDLRAAGETRCKVTHFWTDGRHDMPATDVEGWRKEAQAIGAEQAEDLDGMLDAVDGAMVLSVSGHRHLADATKPLGRGMPTYVDKPLTCSLTEAKQLLQAARDGDARCYSASSLRFASELERLPRDQLGELVSIDATGPGELNDAMAGLFFYGVHTIEMVDAIWGPGVSHVSAIHSEPRDLVRLAYRDGRFASLRLERKASYTFAATVHGTEALHSFEVDFDPVYGRLVRGMCNFFEGGDAPVTLRDIVENVAVMEAGNRSIENGGAWMEVETIA